MPPPAPVAAPKSEKPAPLPDPGAKPKPAQAPAAPVAAATAGERPLHELPYTPSLDLAALDRSADPCVDFYQFTCGGWMKSNPIPGDEPRWSVYGKLEVENQQFLWGILEEAAKGGASRTPVRRRSATTSRPAWTKPRWRSSGISPLKPELARIAGLLTTADIAALLPALLGLPDRDYYVKEDAKSKEIREKPCKVW